MTQSPLEKLIILAVASGMTVSEFRTALNAMETASQLQLENLFKQVRNRLRHLDESFFEIEREFERSSSVRRDVLALVKVAGLPPSIAAERIATQVSADAAGHKLPEFNPREGLARWIERVARLIGESALLNAAVAAFSPSRPGDKGWTLNRP